LRGYLLDTNALSEPLRKRPSPAVLERLSHIPRESLVTSSLCVTELRHGAARHPDGGSLWTRIAGEVLSRVRVLPFGLKEAEHAGDILASLESSGQPIGIVDVLIGATARVHGLVMVTRNVRHFDRIDGLVVESWW
jgi:tRNA(fMet)-specific endonuclease VapC